MIPELDSHDQKQNMPRKIGEGLSESGSGLMDVKGVAIYLGVKEPTIYGWVHQRKIPFTKVGSLLRFPKKKIDAWLEENTEEAKKY